MVNLSKVENMLNQVGAMPIDALKAWFPNERPEEIVSIIEKSDKFMLSGSKVLLKTVDETNNADNKRQEVIEEVINVEEVIDVDEIINIDNVQGMRSRQDAIVQTVEAKPTKMAEKDMKPINKPVSHIQQKENVSNRNEKKTMTSSEKKNPEIAYDDERIKSKILNDLTYDELLISIENYNKKIKKKLDVLQSNEDKGNLRAVLEFLKERYDVASYKNNAMGNMYSLYKKGTRNLVSYGIIVDILNQETLNKVDELFNCETVFIYYIKECQVNTDSSLNTYFVKSATAIIKKYRVRYNLNASQHKLLVIEESKGER